jgi:hypothetical protein
MNFFLRAPEPYYNDGRSMLFCFGFNQLFAHGEARDRADTRADLCF